MAFRSISWNGNTRFFLTWHPRSFLIRTFYKYSGSFQFNFVCWNVGRRAIVVTEFADRQQKRGFLRREAYKTAAKRMALPIIASTATTLAAFFPLIFWPGIVGEFMKFLPITLVAVLSASLIMALIFVPTIGGLFGSGGNLPAAVPHPSDPDKSSLHERVSAFGKFYKIVLEKALNNPGKYF